MNLLRGIFMAFADSVPGVSGGTVAFVMGFYSEFIESLDALVSKSSFRSKQKPLLFLGKLGIGWVFGFLLSVLFISSFFESHIYIISSLFLGFIVFSLPLIYKEEKQTIAGNSTHLIYTLIGIVVVALLTYFNPATQSEGISMSLSDFSLGKAFYVFIAGMIAISAMVLPGISGSTLLLIFGLYAPVITAIKTVITFDFSPFPLLVCFGLGILVGILSTIKLLNKLLAHHRSQIIYLIFGLMIGSLYAVVMGPTTLDMPKDPLSLSTFSIVGFLLGGLVILGLEKLKTSK